VASPSLIAAQASVGWAERGVVTGTNMFARSIGNAVGIAIFGAVANGIIFSRGGDADPRAVTAGASGVFIAVLLAAVLTVLAALFMPKVRAEAATEPAGAPEPVAVGPTESSAAPDPIAGGAEGAEPAR